MSEHVILLSIPGLRPGDVTDATPTLKRWAEAGAAAPLIPTFPCVTSPVQASLWTGTPPDRHGIIANGFYHRDRQEIEFWVGRNPLIDGRQIWDVLAASPGRTSAVWHAQNIKDAAADFIVTPAPIHEPDGTTKLWCYSKPDGLYQQLIDDLDPFPLQHYWGPLAGIPSTRWILAGARWLIERQDPNFHYVYLPHLDYAAQRFGPNAPQANEALVALDEALAEFDAFLERSPIAEDVVVLVVSEYAMTEVSKVVFPNRLLRDAGLAAIERGDDGETLDLAASAAFAMVDHQFAHVYCRDAQATERAAEVFAGVDGLAGVYAGAQRTEIGLDHRRSGEIVLVAEPDAWLAYYWWLEDQAAPAFARTVDIHRKPGYDPVELFVDRATRGIPLDATLVLGSHGAPAGSPQQQAVVICSRPSSVVEADRRYRDVDVKGMVLDLLR
ncbi:MAG: alkaline phosphatase family protein [Planctomycetes bacterium]|nr:alkaline phosphatase family protein [Planctomycetota bacterium]